MAIDNFCEGKNMEEYEVLKKAAAELNEIIMVEIIFSITVELKTCIWHILEKTYQKTSQKYQM